MSLRIDSFDESTCSGCMTCAGRCPVKAISPAEDKHGFIMPSIDESLCINCGLCVEVCDFKKTEDENKSSHGKDKAYSLIVKNKEVLAKSTSGGAFTTFSDLVLAKGGFVAGAVWGERFSLSHQITNDAGVRNQMRGSKYVQSDTTGTFQKIEEYLKRGDMILFTGTPCQCAGLMSYLDKDYDNLIVMDFLCHGVPNDRLFKDHIEYLENHYKQIIKGYWFRDKKYGWDSYNNVVELQDGKRKSRWINQIYYKFFVNSVSLRESCYSCKYRTEKRYSDITVADFWGIEKITGKHNNTGVSLVITHTEKGSALLSECAAAVDCVPVDYDKIVHRLATRPVKSKFNRNQFWITYESGGYQALADKYFNNSIVKQLRFEARKIAKRLKLGK